MTATNVTVAGRTESGRYRQRLISRNTYRIDQARVIVLTLPTRRLASQHVNSCDGHAQAALQTGRCPRAPRQAQPGTSQRSHWVAKAGFREISPAIS